MFQGARIRNLEKDVTDLVRCLEYKSVLGARYMKAVSLHQLDSDISAIKDYLRIKIVSIPGRTGAQEIDEPGGNE